MDNASHEMEDDDGDAARAFEALRAEVAGLRRGIELIYRQAQQSGSATTEAPDYSPTLGVIAKELEVVSARLDAIESTPALALTPMQRVSELRRELHQIGQDARQGLAHSQGELNGTVRELRGLIASARLREDQRQWLWTAGVIGAMTGILLWFLLTALLPWGGGTWLASVAFGGRWNAADAMMQDVNPALWDRMVRLTKACPRDSTTELCEAAEAVRTISPGQSETGTNESKAPAFGTIPAPPHNRLGR